jgi:hypothetical protein
MRNTGITLAIAAGALRALTLGTPLIDTRLQHRTKE